MGISQYQSREAPPLQYPAEDAKAFYRFLTSKEGLGMSPDQIVILLDNQATVANIRSALGDFVAKQAGPDDTVIFFFAGHGGVEVDFLAGGSPERAKFLLAYDTAPDKFYGTGLNMKDDLAYVFENRIQSRRIMCFLDCCYAGAAQGVATRSVKGRGLKVTDQMQVNLEKPANDLVMTKGRKDFLIASACRPQEAALEVPALKHGVFTYVSLRALAGAADTNTDGLVSVSEFTEYVGTQSATLTKDQQHPQFVVSLGESLILSKKSGRDDFPMAGATYGSSPLWSPINVSAALENKTPTVVSQMIAEDDYLAEVRQEADRVLIAVVGSSNKAANVMEALNDARQKQRQQIRKYFNLDPNATERVYQRGEVVDAQELGNKTWYLVMRYPKA